MGNYKEIENELNEYIYEIKNTNTNKNPEKFITEMGTDAISESEMNINILPLNKDKKCCWNCLKVLLEENSIQKKFDEKIIKGNIVRNNYYIILILIFFYINSLFVLNPV